MPVKEGSMSFFMSRLPDFRKTITPWRARFLIFYEFVLKQFIKQTQL